MRDWYRLEWKDRELVELGADGVVDEPLRDASGTISFDNERPDRRILSFATPTITKAIEDRPTVYSVKNEQKFSRGFRVTAFATPTTMGQAAQSWEDLAKGLELTYGVLGQWNEPSGTIPTYDARQFSPFPHIPYTSYATVADGFIEIPEDGTYEFDYEGNGVGIEDFAVLINDKVMLGGITKERLKPIKMTKGTYPIKVYVYNPSPNFGLTGFPTCQSTTGRGGRVQGRIYDKPHSEITKDIGSIVSNQLSTLSNAPCGGGSTSKLVGPRFATGGASAAAREQNSSFK